jgi:predicted RND superfamily exporter protein
MIIKDRDYAVDLLKQRVGQLEDELSNTERALDSLTDRKKFVNQAKKDEVLDTLRYLYSDYYTYPKERMWSERSEILDVDFADLREFLEKNGVDI